MQFETRARAVSPAAVAALALLRGGARIGKRVHRNRIRLGISAHGVNTTGRHWLNNDPIVSA